MLIYHPLTCFIGFSDPPSDSESDEEHAETISAVTPGKGSKRKGQKKDVTSKKSANNNDDDTDPNKPSSVIYLGHLPVGFEDREITIFLNQFGNVKRCRVSRSTKTGRSRGYAFVEFADAEVAKIVAETMSGYFLLEKRLVCHILPMDKVYENMFVKSRRIKTKKDRQKVARIEWNKRRSAEAMKEITSKLVKREGMKRKRLAELGIEYDFPGYAAGAQSLAVSDGDGSSQKKKSKVADADGDNSKDETKLHELKTPKYHKHKKVKSAFVVESEEKPSKGEVNNDNAEAVDTEKKSATTDKKRKSQAKTPKKGKAPKQS